ncbi:MAG: discoidin domain-containing protein, partial [Gammaproteobacteria bacterium]|nr:discoidin domain-containing protein [Gammaproteobacteria bacterium]
MFVSESSLWVGDNHKITIDSGGKMKFRKRKTTSVPAAVTAASGLSESATATAALQHSGKGSLSSMKLKHWKAYMRTLSGQANAKIKDIFRVTTDDYEEEQGADSWLDSGSNVYLGASGNVGIGNSSPSKKLDVTGDINFTGTLYQDGVEFTSGGGVFTEANAEAYYLGNVGMGTNNPASSLHVYKNGGTSQVRIQSTHQAELYLMGGTNKNGIFYENTSGEFFMQNNGGGDLCIFNNSTTKKIRFRSGGTHKEKMTILCSNGNVGIGTNKTAPAYKLDVGGDINLTGSLRINGVAQTFGGGGSSVWSEASSVASYANKVLIGNNSGGGLAAPGVGTYGSAGQRLVLWYANSTSVPYGMGMNGSTMWSAVPTGARHEYYVHTSRVATFDVNGLNLDGDIRRRAHNSGYQVGLYNTEANGAKTNPIFTIGTNYKPTNTTLENMYGIGYSSGSASFINGSGWGMYVAAGGNANIFFGADVNGSSYINTTGNFGLGTNNPQYRLDVVGTARISSDLTVSGNLTVAGTTTTVSSTTITVADTLLALASTNVANVSDIGFYGKYVSDGTKYAGFSRDATDGVWKLFQVDAEPTTTVSFTQETASGNNANYPPQAMTAMSETLNNGIAEQDGVYTITTSSELNSGWWGVRALDDNNGTAWATGTNYNASSGSYTGSTNLTGTYAGDWIKLQLPTKVKITNYTIRNIFSSHEKKSPVTWKLFGSNDDSTWTEVDSQAVGESWGATGSNGMSKSFNVTPPLGYTYYAMVISKFGGENWSNNKDWGMLGDLNLYGQAITSAEATYGTLKVGTLVGDVTGDITGDITGNVTGNVTGTAATVTGAAQTAITSVGTLTGLTVGGTAEATTFKLNTGVEMTQTTGNFKFLTGSTERMRIYHGGNVSIGAPVTGANTELLDVRTNTAAVGQGARLGEASIGTWITSTGYAAFTNANVKATGNSYAVLQKNDGETFINTAFNKRLNFRINNVDKMVINGDNVGINQYSPAHALDVTGDINLTGSLRIGGVIQSFGGGSSVWTEASAEAYYTGNVGIGTNNPGVQLDVRGTKVSGSVGQLRIQDSAAQATGIGGRLTLTGLYSTSSTLSGAPYVEAYKENATSGNYSFALAFGTRLNGVSTTSERMRISASGNVGIGTNNPLYPLHIGDDNGQSTFIDTRGNIFHGRTIGYSVGTAALHIQTHLTNIPTYTTLIQSNFNDATFKVESTNGSGRNAYLQLKGSGGNSRQWDFKSNKDGQLYINDATNSNATSMTFLTGGNVGIGTTNPGYKLHVIGGTQATDANSVFVIQRNDSAH